MGNEPAAGEGPGEAEHDRQDADADQQLAGEEQLAHRACQARIEEASTASATMVTRSWSTDRKPLSIVAVCCWPDADDPDLALDEDAEQRSVPGQDAELAVHGARDDLAGLALPDLAVSGDQLDVQ